MTVSINIITLRGLDGFLSPVLERRWSIVSVSSPSPSFVEPRERKADEGPAAPAGLHAQQSSQAPATPQPAVMLISEELLQGRSEVLIRHGDEIYRLRQTRNGKLILQK